MQSLHSYKVMPMKVMLRRMIPTAETAAALALGSVSVVPATISRGASIHLFKLMTHLLRGTLRRNSSKEFCRNTTVCSATARDQCSTVRVCTTTVEAVVV
jgi:hypothetical protein